MPLIRRERLREALGHGFVFLAFLVVPLAASPRFADQFTSVKWYALEALAVAWFLGERVVGPRSGGPAFPQRTGLASSALVALVVLGSLRRGPAWALEPLLVRTSFVLLALAAFSYFRRAGLALAPLRAGVATSAAIVIVLGLLQGTGRQPLPWLIAGDQVSATFGNVNMAAQFVGLALTVLLSSVPAAEGSRRPRLALALRAALLGAGLVNLYLLGTRSVLLALAGVVVFLLLIGRPSTLLRTAAAAVLLVALVRFVPSAPFEAGALKRESVRLRLAAWSDTLDLIRDHPLGVGAGNFEQAFIPYALGGRTRPSESLIFRSPHNEYLRVLAEEGLVTSALLTALLVHLLRSLHRSPVIGSWRSPPGRLLGSVTVFLAVEAFLQFPFEMAFPSLTGAVLLGFAWACLEPPEAATPSPAIAAGWGLAASGLLVAGVVWGLLRVAGAEYLAVNSKGDVSAQERACRLDPRQLTACVDGAWLRIDGGDHRAGRRALVKVLDRAPHYFPAIKLLGEDSMAQGDLETGCRYLGLYDALFDGHTVLHERLLGDCPPGFQDALRREVPIPYYRTFPLTSVDRREAHSSTR